MPRRALCQAVTVMLNRVRSNALRTSASHLSKRCGRKREMVALARSVAVVIHRMRELPDGGSAHYLNSTA